MTSERPAHVALRDVIDLLERRRPSTALARAKRALTADAVSPKYEQVGWLWRYVPTRLEYYSIEPYAQWRWAPLANDPTESMKRDEDDVLDVEPVYRMVKW